MRKTAQEKTKMLEDPKEGKVIKEMEGGETKSTLSLKSWDS